MSGPSPSPDLRLLADDLTGALDSAAAFGAGVAVHLGHAPPPPHGTALTAVSLATRDIAPGDLPRHLAGVLPWFAAAGLAFKKVDSLLRGNTVAECAWLAEAGGFDAVLFAPAFPGQGRRTTGGVQWAPVPGEPAAPPRAVSGPLVEAFEAQGLRATVSAPGRPPAWAGVARAQGTMPEVWVPDVREDADLHAVVRAVGAMAATGARRWLWCGSAGLAQALADACAPQERGRTAPAGPAPSGLTPPRPEAGLLMLGASHHEVVRRQWRSLRAAHPAALAVVEGDEAGFEAACTALAAAPVPLAALELSPRRPLTPQQAAALLAAQMQALVARARRPGTLVVVGGDSLAAVCAATGATSLRTGVARRAGWGCATLVGGAWDGVMAHTRSGAFGGDEDLLAMRAALAAATPA